MYASDLYPLVVVILCVILFVVVLVLCGYYGALQDSQKDNARLRNHCESLQEKLRLAKDLMNLIAEESNEAST